MEIYGDLLKEGLLEKLSPSAFRGWQLRAFRLYETALLFSESGKWNPRIRQRILLQHIDRVSASSSGNLFDITLNNGRVYRLRAGTDSDTRGWFQAIREACSALQQGLDSVPLMRRSLGLWAESAQCPTYCQARVIADVEVRKLLEPTPSSASWHRKCRLMCSLSPSLQITQLLELIDAGMDVACLNLARGKGGSVSSTSHAEQQALVGRLREALKQRPERHVAILAEVTSPDIRTSCFREDVGRSVNLIRGQDLKLVTEYGFRGDRWSIGISYRKLCQTVRTGSIILLSDGALALRVRAVGGTHVITEVMNDFVLSENESVRLPGMHVDLPILEEAGIYDLIDFVIPEEIDFVVVSCVQTGDDVKKIRKVLGAEGRQVNIISKIENVHGLRNFDSILEESDGIVVARWGLSMEIPPESVSLAQKMMISKGNVAGKITIMASHVLESMSISPQPSQMEAVDVANAVFDGTDCLWLSSEMTVVSAEAVAMARKICERSETYIDQGKLHSSTRQSVQLQMGSTSSMEAACASAVSVAADTGSSLLITVTGSGTPAFLLAKYRPRALILAVTHDQGTCRHLQCVRGVQARLDPDCGLNMDAAIGRAIEHAKSLGIVTPGCLVTAVYMQYDGHSLSDGGTRCSRQSFNMVTQGQRSAQLPGQCNFLKILTVLDESDDKTGGLPFAEASLSSAGSTDTSVGSSFGQARIIVESDPSRLCHLSVRSLPAWTRKCRIACKLPSSCSPETLLQMIDGGMNAAFVHVSHADPAPHQSQLQLLKEVADEVPSKRVAVIMDVSGREATKQALQPQISDQGLSYALEVAIEHSADFAVLPVRSVECVQRVRQLLSQRAGHLKILAQIEDEAGMINFDAILDAVDGIVLELSLTNLGILPESAAVAQKIMIGKCNLRGKLAILAASPLKSMESAPQPTTVEASGLANAILDGIDGVMLSDETSVSQFPIDAVTATRRICHKAEASLDYGSLQNYILTTRRAVSPLQATCAAAIKMCLEMKSRLLLAIADSADLGLLLAAYRPCAPILAVSGSVTTCQQLLMSRGVVTLALDSESWSDTAAVFSRAISFAKEDAMVVSGDSVVVIYGQSPLASELKCTNLIKMFTLS